MLAQVWTRPRRALALLLVAALVVIGGGSAALGGSLSQAGSGGLATLLPGTVSNLVKALPQLGPLAATQKLTITLPLALPDQQALNAYVKAEYTPGSAGYRHFLTPAEFGARFGAPSDEIARATQALSALGLTVATPDPNHLYLSATAPVSLLQRVFGTLLERFTLGASTFEKAHTVFGNTSAIHLPASLQGLITGVLGLDDFHAPQPQLARAAGSRPNLGSPSGVDGGATPCLAADAGVGYTASDLATAYDFNGLYAKGFHGEGMSAAVVEFDDYHDSNLQTMESCYGITTPVTRRFVDGGVGGTPGSGEAEDMLDLTVLLEMAPKLAHLYVYEAPISGLAGVNVNGASEIDLYNAFVADDKATVLSSSWGNCEQIQSQSYNDLMGVIAEEAAAQGQQIFDAAGDSGAVDCSSFPPPVGSSISVEQEAAIPWITGVGGTDLSEASTVAGTTTHHELPWNDAGAGGGGQSAVWPMPAWQQSYLSATHDTPPGAANDCGAPSGTLCRMVPDISLNADPALGGAGDALYGGSGPSPAQFSPTDIGSPGYSFYCATSNCTLLPLTLPITIAGGVGGWEPIGGTSAATPLLAAAAILWDQQAAKAGLGSTLGFLNPAFYRLASSASTYTADFHDITTGSNSDQYSNGCTGGCNPAHLYSAGPGYDMATGLGSIDVAKLGDSLVGLASQLDVTPSLEQMYGYTHGVALHGSASVTGGANGSAFLAKSTAKWLTVTPAGTVPGSLTWKVNPRRLKPGRYTGRIAVRVGHVTQTTLTVHYTVTPKAKPSISPKAITFTEQAITASGASTTPACNTTTWNDELKSSINGSKDTTAVAPSSLATVTIRNTGGSGSALHWEAFLLTPTSSWLSTDLNPTGNPTAIQTAPGQPLVPSEGTIPAHGSFALKLASVANTNSIGGYPSLNQGTYHGIVQIRDMATGSLVARIPVTLVLGNGQGTPTMAASPTSLTATVAAGQSTTVNLALSDASKTCGYTYSLGSGASWAEIDPDLASGAVPVPAATAAPAGATDTGSGNGLTPVTLNAAGLTAGTYHTTIVVNSADAVTDPTVIPVTLTVTG